MKHYPVLLNLKNKKCLVVGGGKVATRKVKLLLKYKANITVIAKKVTDIINKLNKQNKIKLFKRAFKKIDLKNTFLVICATNDKKVNQKISSIAKKNNILVNVVDAPEFCNFIVPSTIQRGNLSISISTSGTCPGLAKKIRQELEIIFDNTYSNIVDKLTKLRKYVKKINLNSNELWEKIFDFPLIKDPKKFLKRIKNINKKYK